MDYPKVTVMMPVYNGERHLVEAVESILNQTFRDFEFIIINDGSTDSTADILARCQQLGNRIRVYHQENKGITASRNRGCHLARGEYIAVMDADDVSLPQRLARQVQYLDIHPEVGVLGGWMEVIDENGVPQFKVRYPTTPGLIRWALLTGCCMAHSSVMMRRDVIEQLDFYRLEALLAEDYDLWARASFATQLANIPEILVRYRAWQGSTSARHLQGGEHYADKVSHSMITQLLGSDVSLETVSILRSILLNREANPALANSDEIESAAHMIQQLCRAYLHTNSLNRAEANEVAQDAGMKLLILAASTAKLSLKKRFFILARALRLHPQLLFSRHIITKGLGEGTIMLMGRA